MGLHSLTEPERGKEGMSSLRMMLSPEAETPGWWRGPSWTLRLAADGQTGPAAPCSINLASHPLRSCPTPAGWVSTLAGAVPWSGELPQTIEGYAAKAPFAVWEPLLDRLRCFSHPLGRGTFFYLWQNGRMFLSTSLQDLVPFLERVYLDRQMVAEYLTLARNTGCDQERTFVQGVSQVPPGHCLQWAEGSLTVTPYWRPQLDPELERLELAEAADRVVAALQSVAAGAALVSGCMVSGGLDSSVVAATVRRCQKAAGGETHLLTLGHGVDSPEEQRLLGVLSGHLGLELCLPRQLTPALQLGPLRALNRTTGAPSGGLFTGLYEQLIEEAASRGIGTLFGGEGGDEVFHTSPQVLADLLRKGCWGAALGSLGFITSQDGDANSLNILAAEGLLPLACASRLHGTRRHLAAYLGRRTRAGKNMAFLKRLLGTFSSELDAVGESVATDLRRRRSEGWSFALYANYRQVLDVPFYEACWPYPGRGAGAGVRVVNPLADVAVFRAAMTLRLDRRVGTWVGFRPKRLLAIAAGSGFPRQLGLHPKIGVSDLVARMTKGQEEELTGILRSERLREAGIEPDPDLLDPRNVPPSVSLYWALLLTLVIWFEELRNGAEQRR